MRIQAGLKSRNEEQNEKKSRVEEQNEKKSRAEEQEKTDVHV